MVFGKGISRTKIELEPHQAEALIKSCHQLHLIIPDVLC